MGSGIRDVSVCLILCQAVKDLQQFGTVGGTVQQGGSKVKGHGSFVSVLNGKGSGGNGFGDEAQNIILPAVEGQNLIVCSINGTAGIRLANGIAALCGNLINAHGAVGGRVVTHWGSFVN